MLSKKDIQNELGKGINIVPFDGKNIKENSINLSASIYAWTMSSGEVVIDKKGKCFLEPTNLKANDIESRYKFSKGDKAVVKIKGKDTIILLPLATTLIETNEVLAVDNRIGGTYHSKVGIANRGIGHIGTMLGPNFSGHSLVPIHNITNEVLLIEVEETFISVAFNYLSSPIDEKNPTINGHFDKLAELGAKVDENDRKFIVEDWKNEVGSVREKMLEYDEEFKKYKKNLVKKKLKAWINKNFWILIFSILALAIIYYITRKVDESLKKPVWVDRYFTAVLTMFVGIIGHVFKSMKLTK